MLNDVKEFCDKFNQKANKTPGFLPDDAMKQRLDFQLEELLETAHAAGFYFNAEQMEFKRDGIPRDREALAEVLDGLVDQVYVALGTAYLLGFFKGGEVQRPNGYPVLMETVFEKAWDRIHSANMKKEIVPGMWKIQKPKGWVRPDLSDLVGE